MVYICDLSSHRCFVEDFVEQLRKVRPPQRSTEQKRNGSSYCVKTKAFLESVFHSLLLLRGFEPDYKNKRANPRKKERKIEGGRREERI